MFINSRLCQLVSRSACGSTLRITFIALALAMTLLTGNLIAETSGDDPYDFELLRDDGTFEILGLSKADAEPDWQLLNFNWFDIHDRKIRTITKCTVIWLGEDTTIVKRGEERRLVITHRGKLSALESCLNPRLVFKPIDDLDPRRQEGHFSNPFVGQLIIETNAVRGEVEKKTFTIGITERQFSLETQNLPRYYFHSAALAQFYKMLLADEMNHALSDDTASSLSGERFYRKGIDTFRDTIPWHDVDADPPTFAPSSPYR